MMHRAQLIIRERAGHWAGLLRHRLRGQDMSLCETRSHNECLELLRQCPESLSFWEITRKNLLTAVDQLAGVTLELPRVHVMVVSERGLDHWQWVLREAGALHVVLPPYDLTPIETIVRRYLAALPPPAASWREAIWSRLPWAPIRP